MPEDLNTKDIPDEDEIYERQEAEDEARYQALLKNKKANYNMIRHLRPITINSIAALELAHNGPDFFKSKDRILKFKEWTIIEGGQIRAMESTSRRDNHGYLMVRPEDDLLHEIIIRASDGWGNSVVIMPRSDNPLPAGGKMKDAILEQMVVLTGDEVRKYDFWLKRLQTE